MLASKHAAQSSIRQTAHCVQCPFTPPATRLTLHRPLASTRQFIGNIDILTPARSSILPSPSSQPPVPVMSDAPPPAVPPCHLPTSPPAHLLKALTTAHSTPASTPQAHYLLPPAPPTTSLAISPHMLHCIFQHHARSTSTTQPHEHEANAHPSKLSSHNPSCHSAYSSLLHSSHSSHPYVHHTNNHQQPTLSVIGSYQRPLRS